MQSQVPKPFLQIAGKTILEHTLSGFFDLEGLSEVVIPTSADHISQVDSLLHTQIAEKINLRIIEGGSERQFSIAKALESISTTIDLVIIHDAVRPFVTFSQIQACCKEAKNNGAAVLGVPTKDTIKKIDNRRYIKSTPPRETLWQAQTPQVFDRELILKAYKKAGKDQFVGTDDASLVERIGAKVKMVEGSHKNFKITYPLDLELAKILLEHYEKQ